MKCDKCNMQWHYGLTKIENACPEIACPHKVKSQENQLNSDSMNISIKPILDIKGREIPLGAKVLCKDESMHDFYVFEWDDEELCLDLVWQENESGRQQIYSHTKYESPKYHAPDLDHFSFRYWASQYLELVDA